MLSQKQHIRESNLLDGASECERSESEAHEMQGAERKGSVKAAPVSAFSLGECSSHDELSRICFTGSPGLTSKPAVVKSASLISNPSSSKNADTRNEQNINAMQARLNIKETDVSDSDVQTHNASSKAIDGDYLAKDDTQRESISSKDVKLFSRMPNGEKIPILLTYVSRQGRSKQRWGRDSASNRLVRLTTGCVPITNDGRILFISAARKKEWILPKGGWEADERREESAVRESYEEAGILGTLGPMLTEITFETRKGRTRRLAREKAQSSNVASDKDNTVNGMKTTNGIENKSVGKEDTISGNQKKLTSDSNSFTEEAKKYEMCRMALFPLYISEILDIWPESGRARKVFDINEAIKVTTREEFRDCLIEVRDRGLHLVDKQDSGKDKNSAGPLTSSFDVIK